MVLLKQMRRGLLVTASAIAISGSAFALPGPVDAIWKNTDSTAAQIVSAIGAAAATPASIIGMANEMVQSALRLAANNPPVAVKGVTAACAAGANSDAVNADPVGAANLADACEEAAASLKDIDPNAQAAALESATQIRATIGDADVDVDVEADVENPSQDVVVPDEPGPGPSDS